MNKLVKAAGVIAAGLIVGCVTTSDRDDLFARWQEAGYAQPDISETYDPDQVTVTVQVELARGKSAVKNAVKSAGQPESAVKNAVRPTSKDDSAPKNCSKRCSENCSKTDLSKSTSASG